jgi:hypothetical protein
VLSRTGATTAPESAIVDAALDGTLDEKTLSKLLPAAATAQLANTYRQELARSCEHTLVGQWHREMKAGAADQILDSLRKNFDKHAEAIAHARTLINPESTAEAVIESGQPELVTAWQTLDGHLKVIAKIAAVASQFGCRLAQFPQIVEYSLAENACVDDRALMCCEGSLIADSWLFRPARPCGSQILAILQNRPEVAHHRRGAGALQRVRGDRVRQGAQRSEGWLDRPGDRSDARGSGAAESVPREGSRDMSEKCSPRGWYPPASPPTEQPADRAADNPTTGPGSSIGSACDPIPALIMLRAYHSGFKTSQF